MRKKVIIINRLPDIVVSRLREKFDVKHFTTPLPKNDQTFKKELQNASGIIGYGFTVDDDILEHGSQLEIISTVSVGYNHLNVDLLTEKRIIATNTPDVLTDTVADTIFGLLIATARRIPELDQYVKTGQWRGLLGADYYGTDVHHKTVGIIGMGRIGQAIAHRAHFGFHMDVLYYNRSRKPEAEEKYKAHYCQLPELLQQSDYVVLMTPLTKDTKGLIGAEQFKQMKDTAIFINGSRGATVVEKDLITALKNKEIAAAGLDVFEKEPVAPNNPLLSMENVVTLPHIGSSTYDTEFKMAVLACDNIIAGLTGEKPPSLVNESVWNDK